MSLQTEFTHELAAIVDGVPALKEAVAGAVKFVEDRVAELVTRLEALEQRISEIEHK